MTPWWSVERYILEQKSSSIRLLIMYRLVLFPVLLIVVVVAAWVGIYTVYARKLGLSLSLYTYVPISAELSFLFLGTYVSVAGLGRSFDGGGVFVPMMLLKAAVISGFGVAVYFAS